MLDDVFQEATGHLAGLDRERLRRVAVTLELLIIQVSIKRWLPFCPRRLTASDIGQVNERSLAYGLRMRIRIKKIDAPLLFGLRNQQLDRLTQALNLQANKLPLPWPGDRSDRFRTGISSHTVLNILTGPETTSVMTTWLVSGSQQSCVPSISGVVAEQRPNVRLKSPNSDTLQGFRSRYGQA